jgi:hypothetical protein
MVESGRMRWADDVEHTGRRGMHTGFWWESQKERTPLGRPRRRYDDNIKMDLREIGSGVMECINLSQDRDQWRALVITTMNLRVP